MEHTIAENKEVIVRYTLPTKYDKAPLGSICRVMKDNAKYTLFVQTADSCLEHAEWTPMGDFLEKTFEQYLENRPFVEACLWLLQSSSDREYKDLVYGVAKVLERSVEE